MGMLKRLGNLINRGKINREIDAEFAAHLELRIDDNIARGMSRDEARRDALVRFGNPATTREQVVAADAVIGIESFWSDVRYAARRLIKSPGFAITVVVTLALGIGVNTAGFSTMDAVVLRPLAVPAMDRVVTIADQQDRNDYAPVTLGDYQDWSRGNRSFEQMSVRTAADMSLTGAGDAEHVQAALTSASFFSVLRAQAVLGRVFVEDECRPGRDAVAVLNYGFWQRRFAGDPGVLNRRIQLDQRDYTIIGVLPKTMQYPSEADIFVPLAPTPAQLANRTAHDYFVAARLRDGVTVKQAQAELRATAEHLAQAYPASNRGWTVKVEPLLDGINGDLTPLYYRMIMSATLFVLLVVCANVANLQFARGIRRRAEIAMRTALGASRWRLMRQLLTENILLGLAGGAGGLVVGGAYLHLLLVNMPERVARYMSGWSNTSLNGRVLIFSLALAVAAGIASGIVPAFEALRLNPVEQLKAGARSTIGSGRHHRLRNVFAVTQISLAVALVIGASLMSKGMWSLLHVADTYAPEKVLTFNVALPVARYDTPQKQAAWYRASLDRLRALPGVSDAEVTTSLPYSDQGSGHDFEIENRPAVPGKDQSALRLPVSEGYFAALHIPIIAGRGFTNGDALDATPVAVVSRRLSDVYFPGQSPLGKRIRMSNGDNTRDPWVTIVGVAEETKYTMWDQNQYSVVYLSAAQIPPTSATYVVRTGGNALALALPSRKALATIDAALPLDTVETYAQLLHDSLTGLIDADAMLIIDALIALLLAAIGIFAVMANLVGERTREIGLRLAMGARREDVLGMILGRASRLTAIGLGSGLVLAFCLARLAANLLRGVRADDPLVFAGIAVAIAVIALGSSWVPARRAARIDPMQALRSE